jgi:hypothetical protein
LETVLTSLLFGAGSSGPSVDCGPSVRQATPCALSARAVVAEPGATSEVLDYVRALTVTGDTRTPPKPVLADITLDAPAHVTVSFLRN